MRPAAAILLASLFLAGCTDLDWDRTLAYVDGEPEAAPAPVLARTAPPPARAPAAAGAETFCKSVAQGDSENKGYDPATQARVFQRSYRQCLTLTASARAGI